VAPPPPLAPTAPSLGPQSFLFRFETGRYSKHSSCKENQRLTENSERARERDRGCVHQTKREEKTQAGGRDRFLSGRASYTRCSRSFRTSSASSPRSFFLSSWWMHTHVHVFVRARGQHLHVQRAPLDISLLFSFFLLLRVVMFHIQSRMQAVDAVRMVMRHRTFRFSRLTLRKRITIQGSVPSTGTRPLSFISGSTSSPAAIKTPGVDGTARSLARPHRTAPHRCCHHEGETNGRGGTRHCSNPGRSRSPRYRRRLPLSCNLVG